MKLMELENKSKLERELIALLNLSSWCLVMVERLFLAVPQGLSAVCDCGISWSYSLTILDMVERQVD